MKILALGDRDPGFVTHRELDAVFGLMPAGVECSWTGTDTPQARDLESADGVWLLPGTPYRDDAAAYAGRLCDHLSAALGAHRVFMDVEEIQPAAVPR